MLAHLKRVKSHILIEMFHSLSLEYCCKGTIGGRMKRYNFPLLVQCPSPHWSENNGRSSQMHHENNGMMWGVQFCRVCIGLHIEHRAVYCFVHCAPCRTHCWMNVNSWPLNTIILQPNPMVDILHIYRLHRKTPSARRHCRPESFCASGKFLRVYTNWAQNQLKT